MTVLYTYSPTSQDERRLARWIEDQSGLVSLHRDTEPDRPELARVLALVRSGAARRLAVWRLADLGLSASGLAALLDEFASLGASLVFVADPLDPMTPDGRRMAVFLADALDTQRLLQGERQQDGFDRARQGGKRWGGRRVGTVVRVTPQKRSRIKEMHAAGQSVTEIAQAVSLSRRTIYRVLNCMGEG